MFIYSLFFFFNIQSMLFSVYEEPGDAGLLQLVTVDHVSQRDISGSEDEILDRP